MLSGFEEDIPAMLKRDNVSVGDTGITVVDSTTDGSKSDSSIGARLVRSERPFSVKKSC